MVDFGSWGDSAMKAFVQLSPSPSWANKVVAPYKGLPFHDYIHAPPPRRPRRLTGPIDPSEGSLWHRFQIFSAVEPEQQFHEQAQASFLARLPLDVRMIIYDLVLGGMVFHLHAPDRKSRVVHTICTKPATIGQANHQCHDTPSGRSSSNSYEETIHDRKLLLSLLLTCRRVYSEVIETLYSANTFDFTQNFAAFRFLKLTTPTQRLRSIRHFRMRMRIPHHPCLNHRSKRDWNDLFGFFAGDLSGLQSLLLVLDPNQPMINEIIMSTDEQGAEWVKPMLLMAVAASSRRHCRVEIVTQGTVTDLNKIMLHMVQRHPDVEQDEVFDLASAAVHARIRRSLQGQG
ncbi:hypothetical protein EJ03DRAFT_195451 [Teratosphaeria nubilosa]|uniref:DUF7730 domain-containing protein n=1 Tax=Teratosphaeria nubilosa TaxID=161662 RepID=A0A6G1KYV3_9PEZI|nr:hypothetical protein EJ03DRAFT_195451 [Teratosphaeria nubilosa]